MKTFKEFKEGAEIYTVKKGSYTRKVDGKTADKMKRQGWKIIAKEDVDEQMAKIAKKVTGVELAKKIKDKVDAAKQKAVNVIKLKALRDKLAAVKGKTVGKLTKGMKDMAEEPVMETKITWKNTIINDGTMGIGIFDSDRDKALDAAKQLIIFLRKNKRIKIGGEKEDNSGQYNDTIVKYTEELSKLFFDDKLLDDLEPNGNNAEQNANDLVIKRLRDLGVNIK